ncbi:hypothetical protein AUG19_06080 [archaeon 13_1_20CM_2_54_9]|nr:MAG: hypothetical protein AUG19_06080 [archaeon 13_1_20CM_2_54_9]TMI27109.1 MAG: translation initiation factor [Candidatus Bathyarchaeota archaeon]TMI30739.1 MAG: translation initiation factor [Candidatus Bathyarchaeota archaeon]
MSEDLDFKGLLSELDRSESHLVVRMETRRFGKPVTVIQGLPKAGASIKEVVRILKHRLATGGTLKEGIVILQGDQREKAKNELVKLGFAETSIEVF